MIVEWLNTGKGLDRELVPWTRGFKGKISKLDKLDYLVEGVWKLQKDTVEITELPIGTWTSDFRETMEKLMSAGTIKDYSDTSTDTDILIKIKLGDGGVPAIEKILQDKIRLSNMHLFNSENIIQKYSSPNDILEEFVHVRLNLYGKRREHTLKTLRDKLPYHENIVRFIKEQSLDKPVPDLRRKTMEECDKLLSDQKFMKISDSFDYLLNLPIASLTLKHAQKHEKDLEELKNKITLLNGMTPSKMWLEDLDKLKI
jgi:DNA topoisomerase-2